MPTDEQLREQFEKWSQQDAPPWSPADTPYSYAFAAWLARDAEVQALREALTYALHVLEHLKADNPNPLLPSARWKSIDMARAALAGGETGETE